MTDRHTRSSQAVLLVVLRKKNIVEKKKISALANIRRKTIAMADKNNTGIIAARDVGP